MPPRRGLGAGRVGIKLNPTVTDVGGFMATDQTVATYDHLVGRLNKLPLSHLQLVRAQANLAATPINVLQDTIAHFRPLYRGTLIANGEFMPRQATPRSKEAWPI